ncbi:Carbohydrate sulfotransferase 1 [Armadillidium vulgare]|nr:Carbohydrate sulfotransferase 1 [Armadillidium vulgare]
MKKRIIIVLLLPFLILGFVYIDILNTGYSVIKSYSSKQISADEINEQQRVLLVSYFRSGSSWTGGLLSRSPNTFYVYEPLHLDDPLVPAGDQEMLRGNMRPRLEELFHCGISQQFLTHRKQFSPLYPKCSPKEKCTTNTEDLTKQCTSSDFIIIKSVRYLLSEVEDLWILPSLQNIKVVWLVRDPRGVLNSLSHMEKSMKDRRKNSCSKMREDIQSYQVLKFLYPNNIFFVRYEDLARYPLHMSLLLWRFISGQRSCEEIPLEWKEYLNVSVTPKNAGVGVGSYKVEKKSTQEWQDWRLSISPKLLKESEAECEDVIQTLGYKLLGNINNAKNFSYSVLQQDICKDVPCH